MIYLFDVAVHFSQFYHCMLKNFTGHPVQ